jgi:glycosyltransferase involved in cell wall biosynthesis
VPVVSAYLACLISRKPLVIDIRDGWGLDVDSIVESRPFYIRITAKLLDRLTRRITLYSGSKAKLISTPYEAIRQQLSQIYRMPIVIVRNGVNIAELEKAKEHYNKQKVFARYGIALSDQATVITYTGALFKHYQPELLFNSLGKVIGLGMNIHYVIAGDGDVKERLQTLSQDSTIWHNVHFLGSKLHSEVLELLLASDLAFYTLSPFYPYQDCAMGVKAIEYIACKLPILCIANNNSSVAQLVKRHQLGRCVEPKEGDQKVLTELLELVRHKESYAMNIEKYYPDFINEFDMQKNMDYFYESLIKYVRT